MQDAMILTRSQPTLSTYQIVRPTSNLMRRAKLYTSDVERATAAWEQTGNDPLLALQELGIWLDDAELEVFVQVAMGRTAEEWCSAMGKGAQARKRREERWAREAQIEEEQINAANGNGSRPTTSASSAKPNTDDGDGDDGANGGRGAGGG